MPQSFSIHVEQAEIDELHRRLAATRWPDEINNDKWSYGTAKRYLQELCNYWRSDFDWRKQEASLNGFSHFKTTVDDTGLHFIHHKGRTRRFGEGDTNAGKGNTREIRFGKTPALL